MHTCAVYEAENLMRSKYVERVVPASPQMLLRSISQVCLTVRHFQTRLGASELKRTCRKASKVTLQFEAELEAAALTAGPWEGS